MGKKGVFRGGKWGFAPLVEYRARAPREIGENREGQWRYIVEKKLKDASVDDIMMLTVGWLPRKERKISKKELRR